MNKRSNRLLSMLLALLMIVAVMPIITLSAADDGVLEVYTPEDFLLWGTNSADYTKVELKNDIDMAGKAWTPIDKWGGTFEGNGYTVSNLTADYTNYVGNNEWASGAQDINCQGGLVRLAQNGFTVQNVAFVNMNCIFKRIQTCYGGMIFGIAAANSAQINVKNVVISGKNNGVSQSTAMTLGIVGNITRRDCVVNIENFAFICTNSATSRFDSGFGSACREEGQWAYMMTMKVTNSYVAGIATTDTVLPGQVYSKNTSGVVTQQFTNVYCTGAYDRVYGNYNYASASSYTPVYYKDVGAASFYEAVGEGNEITQEHMYGNSMNLPVEAWNTYDNGLPVPSALKNANALSATMTDLSLLTSFLISKPEDMLTWAANASEYTKVVLLNDIDMKDVAWTPIESWGGTFDGNGYAIYNLTADYTNLASGDGYDQGGLVRKATSGLTFQNVAFINMSCIYKTSWSSYQGMLFGRDSANSTKIYVKNVLISGKNNRATISGNINFGYTGMIGNLSRGGCVLDVENFAFICTDPATSRFYAGFGAATRSKGASWDYAMDQKVTNSYVAGIATTDVVELSYASSTDTRVTHTFNNVYVVGAQDRAYCTYNNGANTLYYKDIGATAFYDAVGAGNVIENKHFYGNNMGFAASAWNTYAASLPVPAALKNAATISEYVTYANKTVISNADQLDAWAQEYNAGNKMDAVLTADIIYNADATNPTRTFVGVKDFANTFDGQGFTIYGLYQEATITDSECNVAFILNLAGAAEVKNVAFRDGVQKLNMAAGADGATIFAGPDGNRATPATLATVVGDVNGKNVSLYNVYSDNALTVSFANSATETTATVVGVGGLLGNLGRSAAVTAQKVQYVGQITVDIPVGSGTADVGGFYGSAWGTRYITLTNAFFVTDFAGDAKIYTYGAGGRVEMPAIRTNHDSGMGYYDTRAGMSHATNAYVRIANSVSDGIQLFTNVYVTNRVQNRGGYQKGDDETAVLNWAYAIAVDGVTEDTQYGGVYPFTRYTFQVDDAQDYTNSANVYYYAVTKQVNAFGAIDQAACAGLNGFTFADNAFPVLADFADNAKDAQQKSEVLYNDAHYLQSIGASIRLSYLTERQGLRFTYAVNQSAFNLVENGYTLEFGMLLIPTVLLDSAELTLANPNALIFSNVGGDVLLDDIQDKDGKNAYYSYWNNTWKSNSEDVVAFNGALVNFAGVGNAAVYSLSFTARAYVIIKDSNGAEVATIYNDAISCSILDIANVVAASESTAADVKVQLNEMFAGVDGYVPAVTE